MITCVLFVFEVLFPGGGNGNPLQYSCLENPMDRGAWRARVHGVTRSRTRLSYWAHLHVVLFTSTFSFLKFFCGGHTSRWPSISHVLKQSPANKIWGRWWDYTALCKTVLADGSEIPHGTEKVSHHVARGPLRGSCVKELLVASGSWDCFLVDSL